MGELHKIRIWIDMDGVLCDFMTAAKNHIEVNPIIKYPQSTYGFFIDLLPIKDAIESYKKLDSIYDVRILTRPSPLNISCYSEKAYWVRKHLGFDVQEKMVLSCDKSIVKGDFLIDDTENANQLEFEGTFIKFGSKEYPDWKSVMSKFRKRKDYIVKK